MEELEAIASVKEGDESDVDEDVNDLCSEDVEREIGGRLSVCGKFGSEEVGFAVRQPFEGRVCVDESLNEGIFARDDGEDDRINDGTHDEMVDQKGTE